MLRCIFKHSGKVYFTARRTAVRKPRRRADLNFGDRMYVQSAKQDEEKTGSGWSPKAHAHVGPWGDVDNAQHGGPLCGGQLDGRK